MNDWNHADTEHVWHPFDWADDATLPIIERAKGSTLYASDGRTFIDAISSWWVNLHGHGNPTIASAIAEQAQRLEHVIFSGFTHRPGIELAQRLVQACNMIGGKVFYSDNGSTAVEVALKMAVQYSHIQGTKRHRIIAFEGAYHGDTFGAMSVGGRGTFSKPFETHLFNVCHIPFPEDGKEERAIAAMRQLCDADTLCFIFEPLVQGSAGMRMCSPDILTGLMTLAKACGALCIADEVMTGFGRTGTFLAMDQCGMVADLVCLSKGISGGFMPLGATVCSAPVHEAFEKGTGNLERMFLHGHSYTGNPMACAAALASLHLTLSEQTAMDLARINASHRNFVGQWMPHSPTGTKARICGTILAIEYPATTVGGYTDGLRQRMYRHHMNNGILLRPLGNVCYVLPPYCITGPELQSVYGSIQEFNPSS